MRPTKLQYALFAVVLIGVASAPHAIAASSVENESLRRACEFLWSKQAADGGWHSVQYAVLRSGQALTPFVLHTLLCAPESVCPRRQADVDRALDFIRQHVDSRGAIGRTDPDILEYPVYSTAYALQCLLIAGRPDDFELATKMRKYLLVAQRSELHGFEPMTVAYGGWGFDWPQGGKPGHMDIAHTRRALVALSAFESRWPNVRPSAFAYSVRMRTAQDFLRVLQRHPDARAAQPNRADDASTLPFDGGFYFSPLVLDANKGREERTEGEQSYFRSYATATCDGVLALLAAGVPREDERVARAVEWLRKHDDLTYPQGIPTDHPEPWGEALRFYHYAVRAEAYAALNIPGDWRERLVAEIARHQAPDGSFRNNVSPLMKEDDPILGTTLAVIGLSHCQHSNPASN